jgi:hypothetical protein
MWRLGSEEGMKGRIAVGQWPKKKKKGINCVIITGLIVHGAKTRRLRWALTL